LVPLQLQRPTGRSRCRTVAGLLLALAASVAANAQSQAQTEAAIKARLTLSLTRFVQWPAAAAVTETLRLCLAQRDAAIARAFAEFEGQVVNGRRIQVAKAPPQAGCHVLYVHASADRVQDLIRPAAGNPVLIVGDAEGTLAQGGMVELVPVNDSIRFDVNMAAVRQAQLTISSQALKLARQVRE
jgi:hypothetical protein